MSSRPQKSLFSECVLRRKHGKWRGFAMSDLGVGDTNPTPERDVPSAALFGGHSVSTNCSTNRCQLC